MLPHPSILLLSTDVILGTCERNKFQWNLKFFFFFFFSLPFMLYHISNGGFCPNMRLALTKNRDFSSEPLLEDALISNICVRLPSRVEG